MSQQYNYTTPELAIEHAQASTAGPVVAVLCNAPVNIATIKYWGKRDTKLILATNASLSATIDSDAMASTTTIIASPDFTEDVLYLNGKREEKQSNRMNAVLREIRASASSYVNDAAATVAVSAEQMTAYKVHIISTNNFPTAAGLASSASGFACLTYTLSQLYNYKESFEGQLTTIARQGSGSACRSLHGGFVAWNRGERTDGTDSTAYQVQDEHHWPQLRILILVASDKSKETPSTEGMQRSVQTSELLLLRAAHVVPARMTAMITAIAEKNFSHFSTLTMRDSNQFHAICVDTLPPIFYLTDTSRAVMKVIEVYNRVNKALKQAAAAVAAAAAATAEEATAIAAAAAEDDGVAAGYTFDAGPNAVIFTLDHSLLTLLHVFQQHFGTDVPLHDPVQLQQQATTAAAAATTAATGAIDTVLAAAVLAALGNKSEGVAVSQIILTKPGGGPKTLRKRFIAQAQ